MNTTSIGKIYEEGKTFLVFPLRVFYRDNPSSESNRLAVSVPKKLFKRAVKRNLIRRRIKEAFRLNLTLCAGKGAKDILLVYIASEVFEYERINKAVCNVLEKLP